MKLSKPFLAIAICLVLALLYVLFFMGEKPKTAQPVPPKPSAAQPSPSAEPAKAAPHAALPAKVAPQVAPAKVQPPNLDVAWKRDPFELPKPLDRKVEQTVTVPMRLSAIMDGRGGRVAIIDQQIVKRGDRIGQEQIVGIENDRVILAREGSQRVLTLAFPAPEKPRVETKPGGAK